MKRLICVWIALAVLLCGGWPAARAEEAAPNVRVLLRRLNLTDRVDLYCAGAYVAELGGARVGLRRGAHATVQVRDGALVLYVGEVSIGGGEEMVLRRTDDGGAGAGLRFVQGGSLYPGDLRLTISGGQLQPVLTLSVEDYLLGVLPWEMSESFPMEALKAQAVCARTYALSRVDPSRAWDVVDTAADQVFRGVDSGQTNTARAVRDTAGIVGWYKGAMATCYYSASNGGQTELVENVWSGRGDWGYYAMTDDPYDLENPESIVRRAVLAKDGSLPEAFTEILHSYMMQRLQIGGWSTDPKDWRVTAVTEVTPTGVKLDPPSRFYTALRLSLRWEGRLWTVPVESPQPAGPDGDDDEEISLLTPAPTETPAPTPLPTPCLSGWQSGGEVTLTLSVFPDVIRALSLSIAGADNEMLTVTESPSAFVVEARRFGHGVGMSQRGAQWMAARYGKTFDEILAFYYPGMTLMIGGTGTAQLPAAPSALFSTPGPAATATPRPTLMPVTAENLPEGAYIASVEGVADDSSLNLRQEPYSSAEILMRLYKHQRLVVLETCEDPAWVHVKTDVIEGYVMVSFLEKVE